MTQDGGCPSRVYENTQRNQRLAHPMMSVPDFFGSTSSNYLYGRFAYDPEEIY